MHEIYYRDVAYQMYSWTSRLYRHESFCSGPSGPQLCAEKELEIEKLKIEDLTEQVRAIRVMLRPNRLYVETDDSESG